MKFLIDAQLPRELEVLLLSSLATISKGFSSCGYIEISRANVIFHS